ncbi:hypothetical protein BDZ97DRAFT_1633002, partial [Flammula alnicola]
NKISKLKDHILVRLLNGEYEGEVTYDEFTDEERNTVRIAGDRIYHCKTMYISYTTYDVRCDGDMINTQTYPDIMVKSSETRPQAQPYWYAHVIEILHVLIVAVNGLPVRAVDRGLEWSRVYITTGFAMHACQKLAFWNQQTSMHFTFLDPAQVIRGTHIIPAFSERCTSALL